MEDNDTTQTTDGIEATHSAAHSAEIVEINGFSRYSPGEIGEELRLTATLDGERQEDVALPWSALDPTEVGIPAGEAPAEVDIDRVIRYMASLNLEADLPDGRVLELYREGGAWIGEVFPEDIESDGEVLFERVEGGDDA